VPELTVIYWRDIPAQLVVRQGRSAAKRELSPRFQEAIDRAAMRSGARDGDAYLAEWRRSAPRALDGEPEALAAAEAARLEAEFGDARLAALVANDGREGPRERLVVFTPSGKRGRVPEGESVLDAARRLGVDLDSVCGGRGICGRCEVSIGDGVFAKHGIEVGPDAVSPAGAVEARYAGKRGAFAPGRRLGCQARVLADLVVDVPPESQVHRQIVRKAAGARPVTIDPVVRLHAVEIAPPTLDDAASDAHRLRAALERQWGLRDVAVPLAVLRAVQETVRAGDALVTAAVRHEREVVAVYPGVKERVAGLAIDVGSTSIVAHLCDLADGRVLASAGAMNPQIRFGEDLMSRVSYAMLNEGGAAELTAAVRSALDALAGETAAAAGLARAEIVEAVLVGNPVMHHLVLGLDPAPLGQAPFAPAVDDPLDLLAGEVGLAIAPGARVHVLPLVAGHVGADAAAVLLSEWAGLDDEPTLIVDVGTNAEIILATKSRILACSSPTGPAFEGAQISAGQRAAPGAIERVRVDAGSLEPRLRVIGGELWSDEPGFAAGAVTGICGSGIVEALAELVRAGVLAPDGAIRGERAAETPRLRRDGRTFAYVLHEAAGREIAITQADVRAIQLAKAALYAGARLLMDRFGVGQVARVKLAGAFGTHLDPAAVLAIGLVPDCAPERIEAIGNAAGEGARMALLDAGARGEAALLVRRVEKIETALEPAFQAHFVAAMAFPGAAPGEAPQRRRARAR
jgi:uncharacterized 2Fe-2S/4Fe-4S cluster protein (DUF4445 family)